MNNVMNRSMPAIESRLRADAVDARLLAGIRHHAARRDAATSYVVSVALLLGDPAGDDDERCVVIALPHTDANDIDVSDERPGAMVQATPVGGSAAVLVLAGNRVALAERAVIEARPLLRGRLVVVWAFRNETVVRVYGYDGEVEEALWLASLTAQSHERPDGEEAAVDDLLIRVAETFNLALPASEAALRRQTKHLARSESERAVDAERSANGCNCEPPSGIEHSPRV
ncbi:hypothetical protein AB4Y44_35880 [Paraburkholderia sp. BR10937]|uniref:hypothetical protein n=1 Tax=Paraburkholderia sp. BR10937 TaxID=3236994 RepID=UPI0034D18BE8